MGGILGGSMGLIAFLGSSFEAVWKFRMGLSFSLDLKRNMLGYPMIWIFSTSFWEPSILAMMSLSFIPRSL